MPCWRKRFMQVARRARVEVCCRLLTAWLQTQEKLVGLWNNGPSLWCLYLQSFFPPGTPCRPAHSKG